MIIINDWLEAIEDELTSGGGPLTQQEAELVTAAIKKHTPFKPETAYMLVPRCEACAHWQQWDPYKGVCAMPSVARVDLAHMWASMDGRIFTTIDFGCVQWEAK
jgi:hypothetical protein